MPAKSTHLRLVKRSVLRPVAPAGRKKNDHYRVREHLTEAEMGKLLNALKQNAMTVDQQGDQVVTPRCRGGLQCMPAGRDDPWRLRIRQGVSRRALLARGDDPAHRTDQSAAHSVLYCRTRAGAAKVVLSRFRLREAADRLF